MSPRLLKEEHGGQWTKRIDLLDEDRLQKLSPQTVEILKKIVEEETYPKKIADDLGTHEQKVYYHVRKLEDMDIIEPTRKEQKGGALCKFYRARAEAFGFDLGEGWSKANIGFKIPDKLLLFFSDFVKNGTFKGSVVVGSPEEHGPFMTSARDGHYAVQLGIFLGNLCDLEERFVVKLDTEVEAEGSYDRNLMLVGGPMTNMVTRDLNEGLKVRFDWDNRWKIASEITGKEYTSENIGLIAKTQESGQGRILVAGRDFRGTKTSIIAITQNHDKVLDGYEPGNDFYRVVKGLDRDGDGKTDEIEILE